MIVIFAFNVFGTPQFLEHRIFYNTLKECNSYANSSYNYVTGYFEYTFGDYPYDIKYNENNCNAPILIDISNVSYGYDTDYCADEKDNNRILSFEGCGESKTMLPFYIKSCSIDCDISNPSSQKYTYRGALGEQYDYNTGQEKFSNFDVGSYQSAYRCTYTPADAGKIITMRMGCIVAVKDYYLYPYGGKTFLDLFPYNIESLQYKSICLNNCHGESCDICGGVRAKVDSFNPLDKNYGYVGTAKNMGNSKILLTNFMKVPATDRWLLASFNKDFYGLNRTFMDANGVITTVANIDYKNIPDYAEVKVLIKNGTSINGLQMINLTVLQSNMSNITIPQGNLPEGDSNSSTHSSENQGTSKSKQLLVDEAKQDSFNRSNFMISYLQFATLVFSLLLLLFYVFEVAVLIYVMFKFMPRVIGSVEEILKRIVKGK